MTSPEFSPDHSDLENELARHLAVTEIPSVPVELNTRMRKRLNQALLTTHWIDFLVMVIPSAITALLNPIGHLITHTFAGRQRRSPGSRQDD
ncbi:MAG: hypothetical protein CMJ65_13195 [Planctomycetaceae bacterium]|jgi:hypothetical protein|nr:hypothetical protein [Planctomycetaceae bacterium]MDP7276574.1 hypothetical protein [Planctomycetaceae bacterium]